MQKMVTSLEKKKQELDSHRPLAAELVSNLDQWFKVELTYTSNAIEGNTLSRAETSMVVEKNITVEGKSLEEHLEAVNHAQAVEWIRQRAGMSRQEISQKTILDLHRLVLQKIDDDQAGRFRTIPVRIAGSRAVMPAPAKVPELMDKFIAWLQQSKEKPVTVAAKAHLKLVSIHPFTDGNGRTARLLMNLLLMQANYPPAIIRKKDRRQYINSIEQVQLGGASSDYYKLVYQAVDRSLDVYLEALENKEKKEAGQTEDLLKIGQLAKLVDEAVSTIRYWTNKGLLEVADYTAGGYQLYSRACVRTVKKIRRWQDKERLSLDEIKQRLER